ncbi:MAG: hypothetical protein Q8Q09_23645 [Deltaproteobacteria bacterium]|nr:hypothetical protein [Deltaproteobacteria bacterium]
MLLRCSLALALVLTVFARDAHAQPHGAANPTPRGSLDAEQTRRYWMADAYALAGFNQLQGALFVGLRHRWDRARNSNVLLDNRRFELGLESNINPAFTSLGAYIEWTPLQILQLRMQTDVYGYYGIFGAILGISDRAAPYGDDVRHHREAEGRAGIVQRALGRVSLRGQLGPVILVNTTDVAAYALHGSEPYWIILEHDLLIARRDVLIQNEVQLLIEPYRHADHRGLYVGLYHLVAATAVAQVRRQKIAALSEWVFAAKLGPFARPRAIVTVGMHLEDRNRQNSFFGIAALGAEFDL